MSCLEQQAGEVSPAREAIGAESTEEEPQTKGKIYTARLCTHETGRQGWMRQLVEGFPRTGRPSRGFTRLSGVCPL